MPVRLFHKLAFGADGIPGASRTLVLNRALDEAPIRSVRPKSASCASSTTPRWRSPPSIGKGGIVRTNPLFARLFKEVLNREAAASRWRRGRRTRPLGARRLNRVGGPRQGRHRAGGSLAVRRGQPLGAFLGHRGRGGRTRPGSSHRLRARDHGAAQLEKNVTKAEDELGRTLAGGIAHDFNNVLSVIIMAADWLSAPTSRAIPRSATSCDQDECRRAANLVRHLLAFSRRQTMRPEVFDLGEALERPHHPAAPADRREGRGSKSCTAATCGRSRPTSSSSSR